MPAIGTLVNIAFALLGSSQNDTSINGGNATILMKLKAGSDTFHYESPHWTTNSVLNNEDPGWSAEDNTDAKYQAFNDQPVSKMKICYKDLDNCYKFDLGREFPSARDLFDGPYRPYPTLGGGGGKEVWTEMFIPKGTKEYGVPGTAGPYPSIDMEGWINNPWSNPECPMLLPGINTEYGTGSVWDTKVRIGYMYSIQSDGCWKPSWATSRSTAGPDGGIGIGLRVEPLYRGHDRGPQPYQRLNAPHGVSALTNNTMEYEQENLHQAWLFAIED